jgi:hypothetical protein
VTKREVVPRELADKIGAVLSRYHVWWALTHNDDRTIKYVAVAKWQLQRVKRHMLSEPLLRHPAIKWLSDPECAMRDEQEKALDAVWQDEDMKGGQVFLGGDALKAAKSTQDSVAAVVAAEKLTKLTDAKPVAGPAAADVDLFS